MRTHTPLQHLIPKPNGTFAWPSIRWAPEPAARLSWACRLPPEQCTDAHLHNASDLATGNVAAATSLLLKGSATSRVLWLVCIATCRWPSADTWTIWLVVWTELPKSANEQQGCGQQYHLVYQLSQQATLACPCLFPLNRRKLLKDWQKGAESWAFKASLDPDQETRHSLDKSLHACTTNEGGGLLRGPSSIKSIYHGSSYSYKCVWPWLTASSPDVVTPSIGRHACFLTLWCRHTRQLCFMLHASMLCAFIESGLFSFNNELK